MDSVFRVLRKPMLLQDNKALSVVLACIHLHNFLRRNNVARSLYTPPGTFDSLDSDTGDLIPGERRKEQPPENTFFRYTTKRLKKLEICLQI